jgi:hypothetical protein
MSKAVVGGIFVFACLGLCSQSALAQQEVPKVEVGPLFTLNTDFTNTDIGFGRRVTFNPHKVVGLEAEVSHYPNSSADFLGLHVEGSITTALFGVKLTKRFGEQAAVFAKVRPGLVHGSVEMSGVGGGSSTKFPTDFGGGFEVVASKRVGFRVDAGDVIVWWSGIGGQPQFDFHRRDHVPVLSITAEFAENMERPDGHLRKSSLRTPHSQRFKISET